MKKINNIFDCLENAEGSDMERLTKNTPQLDDKQLERILEMSERKYNIKKNNEINAGHDDDYMTEAEGVEKYKRPMILFRFGAIAAALVLTGGIAAAGLRLLKNRSVTPNVPSIPNTAATSVTSGTVTTDEINVEITSVTYDFAADITSVTTTSVSTDITSCSQEQKGVQSDQTTQASPVPSNTETQAQQAAPQTTASPNALTEDQCLDVINQKNEDSVTYDEILQVPVNDYLDFSDYFFVTGVTTHDTFAEGHPLLDEPNEFSIKFVHYTDPRFSTIDDIKNFVRNYEECWYGQAGQYSELFDQAITPGSVITKDFYVAHDYYVYTVYNGKIYRGIDSSYDPQDMKTHDEYYTDKLMPLRLGNDYFRNITDKSFEDYRINEDGNGGYRGMYSYYYYDGQKWRTDNSKSRSLSDAECRQILPY